MKKLIFMLIVGSLFMGCAKQMQNQWELDMPVDEFKTQNDNLLLIEKSADTTIYFRRESDCVWNDAYDITYKYTFINDELDLVKFWYPIPDRRVNSLEQITTSSGSFHFLPRYGIGYHKKGSNNIFGTSIGYGADSWGRISADVMFLAGRTNDPFGFALMLVYENKYRGISFQTGGGITSTSWENNNAWDGRDEVDIDIAFRFGLGYEYPITKHFIIKPAYELNLGLFEGKYSSFSGININFGWK